MKVDAIAKFARIIQSCRECSCGRRLRRRRLQVVTDPPVGIRPEINSHTPREKLHVSVSLSFSFSLARLFPIPFSLLLSRDPCRRFNVSLSFCIPPRLTLSLFLAISVAYGTNSAPSALGAHSQARKKRSRAIGLHTLFSRIA